MPKEKEISREVVTRRALLKAAGGIAAVGLLSACDTGESRAIIEKLLGNGTRLHEEDNQNPGIPLGAVDFSRDEMLRAFDNTTTSSRDSGIHGPQAFRLPNDFFHDTTHSSGSVIIIPRIPVISQGGSSQIQKTEPVRTYPVRSHFNLGSKPEVYLALNKAVPEASAWLSVVNHLRSDTGKVLVGNVRMTEPHENVALMVWYND